MHIRHTKHANKKTHWDKTGKRVVVTIESTKYSLRKAQGNQICELLSPLRHYRLADIPVVKGNLVSRINYAEETEHQSKGLYFLPVIVPMIKLTTTSSFVPTTYCTWNTNSHQICDIDPTGVHIRFHCVLFKLITLQWRGSYHSSLIVWTSVMHNPHYIRSMFAPTWKTPVASDQ